MPNARTILAAAIAVTFASVAVFSMPAAAQKKNNTGVSKPTPNTTTGPQTKGLSGTDLGSTRRK